MRAGVPAGLGRCWAVRFGAGFGLYMTLTAKRQASGRKSSSFRPFSLRASLLPLRMSSRFSAGSVCLIWVGWRHRGGGWRRVRLIGVLGVSCAPAAWGRAGRSRAVSAVRLPCWPCWAVCAGAGHGRRSQANRLANRQNAQRFNKKCSIMTKIMLCILCFLRCKYACFGVK